MTRPAVGSSWGANCARCPGGGPTGGSDSDVRPLTLARWGTDDADGAAADPDAAGVLTAGVQTSPRLKLVRPGPGPG